MDTNKRDTLMVIGYLGLLGLMSIPLIRIISKNA